MQLDYLYRNDNSDSVKMYFLPFKVEMVASYDRASYSARKNYQMETIVKVKKFYLSFKAVSLALYEKQVILQLK